MNKEQKSRVIAEIIVISVYLIHLSFIPAFIEVVDGDPNITFGIIIAEILFLIWIIIHLSNTYRKYKEKR